MTNPTIKHFLRNLEQSKHISSQQRQSLEHQHPEDHRELLKVLSKQLPLSKPELGQLWANELGLSFVDLDQIMIQKQISQRLPYEFSLKNHLILLYQIGDAITAASDDPTNLPLLVQAESLIGTMISPVFSFTEDIIGTLEREHSFENDGDELMRNLMDASDNLQTDEDSENEDGPTAIEKFLNAMFLLAIHNRASDIHLDPSAEQLRIRFRIDGALQDILSLSMRQHPTVSAKLKLMATLDTFTKRNPQDGQLIWKNQARQYEVRVSTTPLIYGEKIVLRLLGESQKEPKTLKQLRLSKINHDLIMGAIQNPNGQFLVTGPTGSGKTTTLYAILNHLNKPRVNIMTIEDPVEYRVKNINQLQVNPNINLDFPDALRSFLRQDPDIIMIGEIRDGETAQIATQAALTGHFVLGSLHTNGALQTLPRLTQMGVKPQQLLPTIVAVLFQRLIRQLCERCRAPHNLSPMETDRFFVNTENAPIRVYRPNGCSHCNQHGYLGRLPIHELLYFTDQTRSLYNDQLSQEEITQRLPQKYYQSLDRDGLKKVLRGLTTIEELSRIALRDL